MKSYEITNTNQNWFPSHCKYKQTSTENTKQINFEHNRYD